MQEEEVEQIDEETFTASDFTVEVRRGDRQLSPHSYGQRSPRVTSTALIRLTSLPASSGLELPA